MEASEEKDIRFSQKKVDETWKDDVAREILRAREGIREDQTSEERNDDRNSPFIALVSSLGMQAFIQLGEIEDPLSKVKSQDLAGAQATISLLLMLKQKTKGNLSSQEARVLDSLLYELQMKFVQYSRAYSQRPRSSQSKK